VARPPWRGGLRTPANETLLPPVDRPSRPPAFRAPFGNHDMPRFGYGRAMRTHRVRPPDKTAFRVVPRSSPQGHLTSASPPSEGRAPHARDVGITPSEMSPPFGHRSLSNSSAIMTCLGPPPALPPGRGDRAPPRKSPSASAPGFPREAIPARMTNPPEGRAPHARKNLSETSPHRATGQ